MQCPSGALQNPTSPQILGRVGARCIFALIFLQPSRAAKKNVQNASRIISVLPSLAFTELLPSGIHINKLAVASRESLRIKTSIPPARKASTKLLAH